MFDKFNDPQIDFYIDGTNELLKALGGQLCSMCQIIVNKPSIIYTKSGNDTKRDIDHVTDWLEIYSQLTKPANSLL